MIRLPALATIGLAALATVAVSAPVSAATYDLFTSFDGATNPVNNFTFGVFNETVPSFTAFASNTGCTNYISDTVCLNTNGLPGVYKTTTGAHQSGTVMVPADALIFHPGPDAGQSSGFEFTAPTTGNYTFSGTAFVADNNPSGVNIGIFSVRHGMLADLGFIGALSSMNTSLSGSYTTFLTAGESFGAYVNYAGSYFNDSTGVRLTVTGPTSAVPEPAAMAILGLGMGVLGFARRKR